MTADFHHCTLATLQCQFDFSSPVQVTTVAGLRTTTVTACTALWDEVFGTVREAKDKDHAPAVIPATFNAEALLWTRAGRPKKSAVESCTALLLDFDGCPDGSYVIEAGDLEQALMNVGLAATFFTTWSATEVRPRWRVAVPLAHPVLPSAQDKVWTAVARALVMQLRKLLAAPTLDADFAARHATQLALLPVTPVRGQEGAAMGHKTYPWGGLVPRPVHVDGRPVVPEEVERAKNAGHYGAKLAFIQAAKERRSRAPVPSSPQPYKGAHDTPEAAQGVAAWRSNRKATLTLSEGLAAVEHVRLHGLGARPGGRGSVLSAGFFHLYRCGVEVEAMRAWGEAALTATGGRDPAANLVRDFASQLADFRRRSEEAMKDGWALAARAALNEAGQWAPRAGQEQAAATFTVILARAQHLRGETGGQLSFAQVALVVGLPTEAVVSWRRTLEGAGLLNKWGEGRSTHYAIVGGA